VQVLTVGKHKPTNPTKTYCFGKPRSLRDATVIDWFNPNSYITPEQLQWELQISSRQLLRYRELALLIFDYRTVAKNRNSGYRPRPKGSTLPRIDQPPFTLYEAWVIKKVKTTLDSLKSFQAVMGYVKCNPNQFSALTFAQVHSLEISENVSFN